MFKRFMRAGAGGAIKLSKLAGRGAVSIGGRVVHMGRKSTKGENQESRCASEDTESGRDSLTPGKLTEEDQE
jgi:hypothetical protein